MGMVPGRWKSISGCAPNCLDRLQKMDEYTTAFKAAEVRKSAMEARLTSPFRADRPSRRKLSGVRQRQPSTSEFSPGYSRDFF